MQLVYVENVGYLRMLWLFNIHIFRQLLKYMFDLFNGVVSPFNYTALVVSGKARIPLTGLTKPVEWLSLLQLTVLSWSAIVVLSKILVAFLFCKVSYLIFL